MPHRAVGTGSSTVPTPDETKRATVASERVAPPVVIADTATAAPETVAQTSAPIATANTPLPGTGSIAPGFSIEAPAADRPVPAALARQGDDSVLARIVAGLSIPASELGVPEMPVARPEGAPDAALVAEAKAKEARDTAAEKLLADKAAAEKLAADKRAADRKAVADKKALADRKAADAKKLADAKVAAEEKRAARANPARIWVQVAGGAHEPDLPKAWAAAKGKAPKAFAGRQGWWTPLKSTNRVLAGPFKDDADARDFVNALAKEGVSAFPFTSDKGQPITRLPTK